MSDQNASGRIRVSLRKAKPDQELTARGEIPRILRLLALAHRWHRLIDEGTIENQAEIARMTGLTRARVTQIMGLRWLSPACCSLLAHQQCTSPGIEQVLRSAIRQVIWGFQLTELGAPPEGEASPLPGRSD